MTGKDIVLATVIVFLWSTNLIVQKIAVGQVSVFVLSFLRVFLVFPLIFIFPRPQKSIWIYSICGFFLFGLYLILFNLGLRDVGANLTAYLTQTHVFFAILAFYVILGEKPTWSQVFGILISFVGVFLFSAASSTEEFPIVGVLYMIGSCISYGVGIALSKKYKIGGTLEDMAWMAFPSALPVLLVCFFFEGFSHTFDGIFHISYPALFAALYAVIIVTLWTSGLWLSLLQRAPSSSVMPFVLIAPFFTAFISHFILDETLTFHQLIAGFIILLGVMFAQNLHQRIPSLFYWVKNRVA